MTKNRFGIVIAPILFMISMTMSQTTAQMGNYDCYNSQFGEGVCGPGYYEQSAYVCDDKWCVSANGAYQCSPPESCCNSYLCSISYSEYSALKDENNELQDVNAARLRQIEWLKECLPHCSDGGPGGFGFKAYPSTVEFSSENKDWREIPKSFSGPQDLFIKIDVSYFICYTTDPKSGADEYCDPPYPASNQDGLYGGPWELISPPDKKYTHWRLISESEAVLFVSNCLGYCGIIG